ncbi:MAG TPA: hypothetical protein V6D18_04835 [Thermosynechococcaceae cyanobacterium]|jgi:hypothetical protein
MFRIHLLPFALAEMFAQISMTRKVTLADRYGMMAALLDGSIEEEEIYALDRIFHALRKGHVAIVDEISQIQVFEPSLPIF